MSDRERDSAAPAPSAPLVLEPIGFVRSPFRDRSDAPRQARLAANTEARIELLPKPELEHALADLEHWSHIWVLFWFHHNREWHAKVAPPRSAQKRGLFSTRSPYRPNPIGMSAVALERIEGRVVHIRGADMLDGTPVLDLKPYVPYADSLPANSGWLERPEPALDGADPGPRHAVRFAPRAQEQLAWLREHGVELEADAVGVLSAGAAPHAYRRNRRDGAGFRLGLRDFRLYFTLAGTDVCVERVESGYRPRVLADPAAVARAATPLSVHRAFVGRFGS
jgi:tRNA-Thr(GGU) m(6)t(6)A37 methyltransferase TsaA